MVAGFAEALPGGDVVVVPDGGVAVGGAAGVVPDLEEALEPGWEEPGFGVHRDKFPSGGGGVEPAEEEIQFLHAGFTPAGVVCAALACAVPAGEGEVPGGCCGDGAVAGEVCGFGVCLQEGAVGHDELDLHPGHPAGGCR